MQLFSGFQTTYISNDFVAIMIKCTFITALGLAMIPLSLNQAYANKDTLNANHVFSIILDIKLDIVCLLHIAVHSPSDVFICLVKLSIDTYTKH